jgi:hypothetical protein
MIEEKVNEDDHRSRTEGIIKLIIALNSGGLALSLSMIKDYSFFKLPSIFYATGLILISLVVAFRYLRMSCEKKFFYIVFSKVVTIILGFISFILWEVALVYIIYNILQFL